MRRVDIPEKVMGTAKFGLDVNLPEMQVAVFSRPPVYGAKPLSYDQKAAEKVKGVRKVIPTPQGIAVSAESLQAALKGRDALNVKWDQGSHPQLDNDFVEKSLAGDLDRPGAKVIETGDSRKSPAQEGRRVQIYRKAHAPGGHTGKGHGHCQVWP